MNTLFKAARYVSWATTAFVFVLLVTGNTAVLLICTLVLGGFAAGTNFGAWARERGLAREQAWAQTIGMTTIDASNLSDEGGDAGFGKEQA